MTVPLYNVLFLCTGNTARSILAESILRKQGKGRFMAYSAGSHPKGLVNPLTIETLVAMDCEVAGLRSKSWDEFMLPGAPHMHFVITVCDNAAGEVCPVWPGHPVTAHWGIADPAAVTGDILEKRRAFNEAYRLLNNRIALLVNLPLASLDKIATAARMRSIGETEGATGNFRALK
ncbi:MAG: arsenate reductase ArsC [Hyphomicrobiales bacterium]|nr:arsenate reductase ArsC [Hyphomicrobiales bacterium]MDE2115031.1 arsenate reductase ArsC [Hyphomicrobiales bacterium]